MEFVKYVDGGYPVYYLTKKDETLCAACAKHEYEEPCPWCGGSGQGKALEPLWLSPDGRRWDVMLPIDSWHEVPQDGPPEACKHCKGHGRERWNQVPPVPHVHWEGSPIECDSGESPECQGEIQSAYGDPWQEESEESQ